MILNLDYLPYVISIIMVLFSPLLSAVVNNRTDQVLTSLKATKENKIRINTIIKYHLNFAQIISATILSAIAIVVSFLNKLPEISITFLITFLIIIGLSVYYFSRVSPANTN